MPKVEEAQKSEDVSESLKPYLDHGLDLNWDANDDEALGDCPWCGREGKFSVKIKTGVWRCFVCAEGSEKGGGNSTTFVRKLWEESPQRVEELAKERHILADTMEAWGVRQSRLSHKFLVPAYSPKGVIKTLYRWTRIQKKGQWKSTLLPTSTLGTGIFGLHTIGDKCETIYVCEGPWDAMALWETLRVTKLSDGVYANTSNPNASLLAKAGVIAIPGAGNFQPAWASVLKGKDVVLMFDSDHPKEGRSGGYEGVQRTACLIHSAARSVSFLQWGEDGFDPSLPDGYDVRDHLVLSPEYVAPLARKTRLESLLGKVRPCPEAWLKSRPGAITGGSEDVGLIPCSDYKALVNAWRKALKWHEGMDLALSSILAAVASISSRGDQLWLKIMSPPSSGKTTIADAVAMAKQYVKSKDTIRGFTSGFVMQDGGVADLLSELNGMLFIVTDGDTLLQSPNLPNILSEGRRIYDGSLKSHFKNGRGKDVDGHRMSWILCGTASLRSLDSSELGTRFLDVVLMDGIEDDFEDAVLMRVANRQVENMGKETSIGDPTSQYGPELLEAMKMTGGFVHFLRDKDKNERTNAGKLLEALTFPEDHRRKCTRLGKFVAHMRARPSKFQTEDVERELASRLVSQLIRLASCLAIVMGKTSVDEEVMNRTQTIALQTSRGVVLEMTKLLFDSETGMSSESLGIYTRTDRPKALLKFMHSIQVVEPFQPPKEPSKRQPGMLWRLTSRMRKLYAEVFDHMESGNA